MKRNFFTLVEMVVAMAIFLLVASMIGTASAIFYNAYERSLKTTEKLKEYVAIDQLMDQTVRNAIPFYWMDEDQQKTRFVFEGKLDSIIFTALRRSHSRDNGALIFVRIRLIEDCLVAEYSSYPLLPWLLEENDREELYQREILTRNVESVTFLYAERNSEGEVEFLDEWVEEDHSAIPLAVQMEIQWKNGEKERWLRRTAGSSSNSSYGNRRDQSAVQHDAGNGGIR